MNAAASIEWLPWGEEAFARAAATQRPILLRISAPWCASCRVMELECDSDPFVASSVAERFVPIYVDSDRRPDVNERYNLGGWPTNAFLTPRGELITGGTFFETDTFRVLLGRVAQSWQEKRAEVEDAVAAIRRDAEQRRRARSADAPPAAAAIERIADLTMDEFDYRYGGFGREPKFPHPHSVELLLAEFRRTGEERLREAALMTLEAIWDPGAGKPRLAAPDGGFFRYAARRDWSEPRYEKMLDENAQLLSVFVSAHQLTAESRWAAAARSVVALARKTFLDLRRRVFRSSQSAIDAAAYYDLDASVRGTAAAPAVDDTAYVGANAQMAAALVKAGLVLGDPATVEIGAAVVDGLVSRARLHDDRLLGHVLTPDGTEGPVLLASQVYVARALVDCYEALGGPPRLAAAAELLDESHARLLDAVRQGYTDTIVELGAEGYLSQPMVPLVENAVAADTLLRLAALLDAPAYHARALALLKVIAGGVDDYGFVAAPFALATMRSLAREPVTVAIASPPNGNVRPLAAAAAAIYAPFKLVRFLDPERDHARLRALRPHLQSGPVAVVSRGAASAEPTSDPARVVALLARAAS
jgi:uncharacterized protein YyaL (SSP411 family)